MKNYYGILSEIEHYLITQKCWIDLLNEHCEVKEITDTPLMLLISLINENNEKTFTYIEENIIDAYKN